MVDNSRIELVCQMITNYVRNPSIREVRSGYHIRKIASDIVESLDDTGRLWQKWHACREKLIHKAAIVFVPDEDLLTVLNQTYGGKLTLVDVTQKLRDIRDGNGYYIGPDEYFKEACLAEYVKQKDAGTEFIAILGYLEEWLDETSKNYFALQQLQHRQRVEDQKKASEMRLLSGADCPWTDVKPFTGSHCRKNGRLYRLVKKDNKLFEASRVKELDDKRGVIIGIYKTKSDATRAISEIAYKDEWN